MKRILLSMAAVLAFGAVNAQIYSAADSADFAAWTTYDADGDGNNWNAVIINNPGITAPGFDGTSGYLSNSWSGSPLTPDNLGISPAIDCTNESTVHVSWVCGSPETTASGWYEEHYAVYVVTAADLPGIMAGTYPTPVFETTLSAGETFFSESVDVSSIAASQGAVHVVLRHYNCTDENWILFDYLNVTSTAGIDEEATVNVTAFPNPANSELNINVAGGASSVSIISMDGKVVSTQEMNGATATVNVSDLNAGVYFYEVATANGEVVRNTFVKK